MSGTSSLIVCHACDLVQRRGVIKAKSRVRCTRCQAELYRTNSGDIDTAIALALSAVVLLALSNAYPLVALELNGTRRIATLMGAAHALSRQGYLSIAVLVVVTTVVVPLTQIASILYLLVPLRRRRRAPGQNALFRLLTHLRPWAMIEVFLLGALVALVRLSSLAEVIPGIALWSLGLLMLTLAALTSATPTEQFWQWVDRSRA